MAYSAANLRRMRRFAEEYPNLDAISAQAARKLAWGHIIVLIQRISDASAREWYVYFIDILMYHLKLRAFVVCELKATKFKPEHTGQLNFYLNLVDKQLKMPQDNPTIGLLLCKSRSKVIAEYALKGIEKPIGVSEYQLTKAIPDNLKANLLTIEEIEAELNESDNNNMPDTV